MITEYQLENIDSLTDTDIDSLHRINDKDYFGHNERTIARLHKFDMIDKLRANFYPITDFGRCVLNILKEGRK